MCALRSWIYFWPTSTRHPAMLGNCFFFQRSGRWCHFYCSSLWMSVVMGDSRARWVPEGHRRVCTMVTSQTSKCVWFTDLQQPDPRFLFFTSTDLAPWDGGEGWHRVQPMRPQQEQWVGGRNPRPAPPLLPAWCADHRARSPFDKDSESHSLLEILLLQSKQDEAIHLSPRDMFKSSSFSLQKGNLN